MIPRRLWRVRGPWMVRSCVVGHLILNHFDSVRMGFIHEFPQFLQVAKMLLDAVVVNSTVAVVVRDILVVVALFAVQVIDIVIPGIQPDRLTPSDFR